MKKMKKDLTAALAKAKEQQPQKPPVATVQEASPNPNEDVKALQGNDVVKKSSSRAGKKSVITYMDAEMHLKLKILAAQNGTTIQELGEQGFKLILEKLGG